MTRRSSHQRGRDGERLAEAYLLGQGFRVLARNLYLRHSEIDLLALERDTLCIVEIRLRSSDRLGTAEASVDWRKQRRLVRVAREVLATRRLPRYARVRFDVVAIDASRTPPGVRLLRDAFYADSR